MIQIAFMMHGAKFKALVHFCPDCMHICSSVGVSNSSNIRKLTKVLENTWLQPRDKEIYRGPPIWVESNKGRLLRLRTCNLGLNGVIRSKCLIFDNLPEMLN